MSKATISAVLIVKNEEKLIKRCIESLKEVDEVVILDTGSSDETIEIARTAGAKVWSIDKPIEPFHFADARNMAEAYAEGEWILSIDADEVLLSKSVRSLRREIKRCPNACAFRVTFRDRGMTTHKIKVFQKGKWQWKFRIHEQLVRKGFGKVYEAPKTIFEHFPPEEKKGRRQQNLDLLKLCIAEAPKHLVAWRQLGQELMLSGEHKKAIPYLVHYSENPQEDPIERSQVVCYIAQCHLRLEELDQAILHFGSAHVIAPRRREPLFWGARALYEAGNLDEAVRWLERTLEIPLPGRPKSRLDSEDAWSSAPRDILKTVKSQRAVQKYSSKT